MSRSLRGRQALAVALVVLVLALLVVAGHTLASVVPRITAKVTGLGVLAPVAFILFYAMADVAFVPGSLLTLTAGALFGPAVGTAVAMVGATLGASAAFLLARYVIRRRVEHWIHASPRLAALDAAVANEGRKIVFLMRLVPLIPFNALNYALGVTRVRFVDYLVASIGMLPGALLYSYYGHVAGDAARLAAGVAPPRGTGYYVLLVGGLLATIALTLVLTRAARHALAATTSIAAE